MKNTINTLEDALVLELENLYCSERKLKGSLIKMLGIVQSEKLRNLLRRYAESCELKQSKIDRVFSYLNHEPISCHTNVIDELVEETFVRLKFAQTHHVQDLLLINCLQRISAYKACAYEASVRYAETLELDTATELLETILRWERRHEHELKELSLHEFTGKVEEAFS
ncbi:DUF892 family protein [Chryseolinea lacunae]|uniref:DUF892 family protein n=1 Tax=Chryseolinea lacunae TaxID=2801331 RepID=A0ABS1KM00_9BACT|nr:DUF892 family protein [Chryseolinea lacunae]MBL0740484.1 DUF892 family protein [Chryseolinea lacunae]